MSDISGLSATHSLSESIPIPETTYDDEHRRLKKSADERLFRSRFSQGESSSSLFEETSDASSGHAVSPQVSPISSNGTSRSGLLLPAMGMMARPSSNFDSMPMTELRAGDLKKSYKVPTKLLVAVSPYFAAVRKPPRNGLSRVHSKMDNEEASCESLRLDCLSGPFIFPDLDEFAFPLFLHWICGGKLHGPHDFHSMNHFLCLYVLATRFQIEELKNTAMDLIRLWYHANSFTAPPYRLNYIYAHTEGPCLMREFLTTTAAIRALDNLDAGKESSFMSESIQRILKEDGDIAVDYANALLKLSANGRQDVRKGNPCAWHEHKYTIQCVSFSVEKNGV